MSRVPCHGSPSLLRSLCAQSTIRHPLSDGPSAESTSVGAAHGWNAISYDLPRGAFSRTRRPHRRRPRQCARSRLTVTSERASLTRRSGNPRTRWRQREQYASRLSITRTIVVVHGHTIDPHSGLRPSFVRYPSSSRSDRSRCRYGLVRGNDEANFQRPDDQLSDGAHSCNPYVVASRTSSIGNSVLLFLRGLLRIRLPVFSDNILRNTNFVT
jgi:hypothetical protein